MKQKIYLLMGSVGVCLFAGYIGSLFTISSIPTWYAGLHKPFFNPPNWLFGPVWTLLYCMMGVSLSLILQVKKHALKERGILFFTLQLILNTLWSIVFFGLHLPGMAFLIIGALWWAIYTSIRIFFNMNTTAAWLLIPYICWVSFAAILNIALVALN